MPTSILSKQELKELALQAIDAHRGEIYALGDAIMMEPELGYKEEKTAQKVKTIFDELKIPYRDGIAITGIVGKLEGRSNKANVAVMSELDAVTSATHPFANPETGAAHACGHNCMMAVLAGVAYAFATTDIMKHLDGSLSLMALPAEEFVEIEYRKTLVEQGKIRFMSGKQEFIYLGEFDDVDIAMIGHANIGVEGGKLACAGYGSNGFLAKMVRYTGRAAHAAASPHLGINALNAANIGLTALSFQRETFQDKDAIRIHPIITKGGDLVNVVPEDVRIETFVRGNHLAAIQDASAKTDRSFQAGAYAVGAQVDIEDIPGYLPFQTCESLMNVMYENQVSLLGEQNVRFLAEPMGGSTDAGDLSQIIPTLHGGFGGVCGDLHSGDFCIIDKEVAYLSNAKALAMTVIDLLFDDAKGALSIKKGFQPQLRKEQYLKEWGRLR